jgi:predicted small secreted protein
MSEHGIEQASERPALAWLFGIAAAMLIAMAVSACNTMEGAGEDVSAAGGALSDSAEDTEDEMD